MMLNIGLVGANGKMGQVIADKLQLLSAEYNLSKFTSNDSIDQLDELCKYSDVVVDFSTPKLLNDLLKFAVKHSTPLVIGTTGLAQANFTNLEKSSKSVAIVYSANMSIGANLIALLAEKAAKTLEETYDSEIVEYHNRHKTDAPSGTALMLAKTIAQAKNISQEEYIVLDRCTKNQPRKTNQIGISSVRGGDIYGQHEILFAGDNEIISIKHQALNRECFADGAISAIKWVVDKKPGLFSMLDVYKYSVIRGQ